jgi:hypothetical protein
LTPATCAAGAPSIFDVTASDPSTGRDSFRTESRSYAASRRRAFCTDGSAVFAFASGRARTARFDPSELERPGKADEMSEALLTPMAAATGVVVIVVAIAVVLVVLIVAVSMRGRQKRGATRRAGNRQ